MKKFSEWLSDRDPVYAENVFGWVGRQASGIWKGFTDAIRSAAWAVRNPTEVPPVISQKISDSWHSLVEKYGKTEATIIMSSLVIGVVVPVPGSIAIFWVTLGVCKAFNSIYRNVRPEEVQSSNIDPNTVKMEAERIKKELIEVAKGAETAR